jgi:DNA modification methylase
MTQPVHRWFRYSAGFEAEWVSSVIRGCGGPPQVCVLDPFAGSGTTLLAAERAGAKSFGVEAHPFVTRVAAAKLSWRTDPVAYRDLASRVATVARKQAPDIDHYPPLIRKCYSDDVLRQLDSIRRAYLELKNDSPASEIVWLTLVSILRRLSRVGTAPWQYVLPNKKRVVRVTVDQAWAEVAAKISSDMQAGPSCDGPLPELLQGDARTCEGVPDEWANLVVTSPPYPNNYDYADATRLEMSFMGDIGGWGDLHSAVRRHLVRSCTQHVPEKAVDLAAVLESPDLGAVRERLAPICEELARVRQSKGGKKTYHLMIATYFLDLSQVWKALRRTCCPGSRVCFVIGDSAPYGVYVPVIPLLGDLAVAAGFHGYSFEKKRDRNVKWKNRKHRVPLQEGHLWVEG